MPSKPTKIPVNCLFLNANPKTNAPKIKVFNGVKEFKIETIELSMFEMANANKKPGIKVPVKAVYNKYFQCFF